MGVCESCANNKQSNQSDGGKIDILPKLNVGQSLIKCTYDIKDDSETQIINDRIVIESVYLINEEIQKKIKIWNDNKIEKLVYRKRFEKLGTNTIYFIIEEKLNDMIFIFNDRFIFNKCISLKQIQFISSQTEEVTDMSGMFNECFELQYIDLSNFNTNNVKNMSCMFNKCHKLKEIKGINRFNTTNVEDMTGMFSECNNLEYLDLSNFNTNNVKNMRSMFNGCHKLKEIKGIIDLILLMFKIWIQCLMNALNYNI